MPLCILFVCWGVFTQSSTSMIIKIQHHDSTFRMPPSWAIEGDSIQGWKTFRSCKKGDKWREEAGQLCFVWPFTGSTNLQLELGDSFFFLFCSWLMNFLLVCMCLLMNNWFLNISMYSEANLSKLTWLVRKIWETWSWYPEIQCKVVGWVWGMDLGLGGQGMWLIFFGARFREILPTNSTMQCGKECCWGGLMSKRIAQSLCLNQKSFDPTL